MKDQQYTVFGNNRPLRVAFFVDPNQNDDSIDEIIKYNHDKWGGRFNPIILTDGRSISDQWWRFLLDYDPDVIYSTIPLVKRLLEKIDRHLSPRHIQAPLKKQGTNDQTHIRLQNEGLSVLPTPENVSSVCRLFGDVPWLVSFRIGQGSTDSSLIRTILYNFGNDEPDMATNKQLSLNQTRIFSIKTLEDLSSALSELSNKAQNVHLSQICTLPNTHPDPEYDHRQEPLTIVVGETAADKSCYWNRIFFEQAWRCPNMNRPWLPFSMIQDQTVLPALRLWLGRMAERCTNGNQPTEIRFQSLSIPTHQLEEICKPLVVCTFTFATYEALQHIPTPSYHHLSPTLRKIDSYTRYEISSGETTIDLPEPGVLESVTLANPE